MGRNRSFRQGWYHFSPNEDWDDASDQPVHVGTFDAARDMAIHRQAGGFIHQFDIEGPMLNTPDRPWGDANLGWRAESFKGRLPVDTRAVFRDNPDAAKPTWMSAGELGIRPPRTEWSPELMQSMLAGGVTAGRIKDRFVRDLAAHDFYRHHERKLESHIIEDVVENPVQGPVIPRGGFFYENDFEDVGSISAAVPDASWLKRRGMRSYDAWEYVPDDWSGDQREHPHYRGNRYDRPF